MNTGLVEFLQKAKEQIQDPNVWVNHNPFNDKDKKSCAYVALGTVSHFYNDTYTRRINYFNWARGFLVKGMNISEPLTKNWGREIIYWNDSHTHEEVLQAFDKAIELAKQEDIHG